MFYVIRLHDGSRLAVNLMEVMGMEECLEEAPDGPRKILRLYLRNGAAFNAPDPDRDLLATIQQTIRFGDIGDTSDVQQE